MNWEPIYDLMQKRLSTRIGRETLSQRLVDYVQLQVAQEIEANVNRALFFGAIFEMRT